MVRISPFPPPQVTIVKPVSKMVADQDEYVGRFVAVESVEVRARVRVLDAGGARAANSRPACSFSSAGALVDRRRRSWGSPRRDRERNRRRVLTK